MGVLRFEPIVERLQEAFFERARDRVPAHRVSARWMWGLISWMYPVFGIRGACWFLGAVEWLTAGLLLLGFWDKRAEMLSAGPNFPKP
jgi:hypothetical protein